MVRIIDARREVWRSMVGSLGDWVWVVNGRLWSVFLDAIGAYVLLALEGCQLNPETWDALEAVERQ